MRSRRQRHQPLSAALAICWRRSVGESWKKTSFTFAIALLVFGGAARTSAQRGQSFGAAESQEIRQSAEKILTSPEFRYFKRLKSGENPLGSGGPSGLPGSGGMPGNGSHTGRNSESKGSQNRGDIQDRGDPGEKSSNSGGGSNTTSSSQSSSMPSVAVPAVMGTLLQLIAWLLLLVIACAIIYLIFMAIRNYDGGSKSTELSGSINLQGEIEPESPPGELPVDVYLSEARKLAAAGQYREAIAQLLLGAMSYAERSGLIRYRRGLTQRDYLRTLRSEKLQFEAMRTMVKVYEPLGFGRRHPAKEHFDQSVAGYEQAFQELPESN